MRFPGFDELWETKPLGSLGTFTKGAPLSKADISLNGTPLILYGELYTTYSEVTYIVNRKTGQTVAPEYYSRIGDVIIPTSGETAEDIATATCVMVPGVILAGDLNIFRTVKVDGRIVSYIIKNKVNRKISSLAQGKSVVHISAAELAKINISFPSKAEQRKILELLKLLDDKIAKQSQFISIFKKYKRGVVQQVFSRRKENKRTCYPKWKPSSFGEYFTEQTIRTSNSSATPLVSLTVENGITPKTERYYREFLVTKEGDNYKAIKPGWFAYNPMNAHLGAIAPNHLGYTAAVSGYYDVFSVNEIDTVNFWEEYLTSYPMLIHYKLIATGSLIEKQRVHYSQFVSIRRKLPSLEEQKYLSKMFQIINAKITNAESIECQLIRLRTSLLQQLFI